VITTTRRERPSLCRNNVYVHTQDVNEYLDLVDQANFEHEDLILCTEDEGGEDVELYELLPLYEKLFHELNNLHADILVGNHAIADDFEFTAHAVCT
jgi:hypothetical protein